MVSDITTGFSCIYFYLNNIEGTAALHSEWTAVWPKRNLQLDTAYRMCYADTAKHFMPTSTLEDWVDCDFLFAILADSMY